MFKHHGQFYADFYQHGKRIRKAFDTAKAARAYEAEQKNAPARRRSTTSSKSAPRKPRKNRRPRKPSTGSSSGQAQPNRLR